MSGVNCVRGLVGKMFHVVDVMQECSLDAARRQADNCKKIFAKTSQLKLPGEEVEVFLDWKHTGFAGEGFNGRHQERSGYSTKYSVLEGV